MAKLNHALIWAADRRTSAGYRAQWHAPQLTPTGVVVGREKDLRSRNGKPHRRRTASPRSDILEQCGTFWRAVTLPQFQTGVTTGGVEQDRAALRHGAKRVRHCFW